MCAIEVHENDVSESGLIALQLSDADDGLARLLSSIMPLLSFWLPTRSGLVGECEFYFNFSFACVCGFSYTHTIPTEHIGYGTNLAHTNASAGVCVTYVCIYVCMYLHIGVQQQQ